MILLDDIKELACKLHDDWWKRYKEETSRGQVIPIKGQGNNQATDGSGNADFTIYQNRMERVVEISRVLVFADGYTPATVWSSGYAYLYTGPKFGGFGDVLDFLPDSPGAQVFPNVAEYSSRNVITLGKNDTLCLFVSGGPLSTNLSVFVYGYALPESLSTKALL